MIDIKFSKEAKDKVLEFMKAQKTDDTQLLRIVIPSAGPDGYHYQFFLDEEQKLQKDDIKIDCGEFQSVADPKTAAKLDGATVNWVDNVGGSGFSVDNPNKPEVDHNSPVEERIKTVFDTEINPALASHGGSVELLEVKGPRAFVKLSGGCQGCASSAATLKQGIEVRIKEVAPEILEVIDTTDHAAGTNPYFSQ